MSIRRVVVAAIAASLMGTALGCATAGKQSPAATAPPTPASFIARVGVEPKRINPSQQETVRVKYSLAEPAEATIHIYDEDDVLVRTLRLPQGPAGPRTIQWNGRSEAGEFVPDGVYRYVISALDRHQKLHLFDPTEETGGQPLKVTGGGVDPATGALRYRIPRAGRVRIRISQKEGGPYLRTLLDWEPREAGEHAEAWDGLDASGQMNLREQPETMIGIRAYSLADNSIIVYGQPASPGVAPSAPPSSAQKRPIQHPGSATTYMHALHPRAICHEPAVTLELPADAPTTTDGVPIVRGTAPLRVILSPADRAHLLATRYEIALYADQLFLTEEEEAYSPFTYLLDASKLGAGPHLITANVLSFDDHIGVATITIVAEP